MLADLRIDSVLFENINSRIANMQKGFDDLQYLLTQKENTADKEIIETFLPLAFVFDIPATSTTYNQMKASGALRYIENAGLTAHLQHYYDYWLLRSIRISEASLSYFSENITPFYLKHIRIQDYDSFNDTLINKNAIIVDGSGKIKQELANIMGTYRSLLQIQVTTMNEPALEEIKTTIALLKEEYKLN